MQTGHSSTLKSRMKLLNAFVILSMLITSGFWAPGKRVTASQKTDAASQSAVQADKGKSRPQFTRPQSRTGVRPDHSESTRAKAPSSLSSAKIPTPLTFIENVGQFDPSIRFKINAGQTTVSFRQDEIQVDFLQILPNPQSPLQPKSAQDSNSTQVQRLPGGIRNSSDHSLKMATVTITFPYANPDSTLVPFLSIDMPLSYYTSLGYFSNVPLWQGFRYTDIYPGMDLEITSLEGKLAWRFVIRDRNAFSSDQDPLSQFGLGVKFDGQTNLSLAESTLTLSTWIEDYALPLFQVSNSDSTGLLRITPILKDNLLELLTPEQVQQHPQSTSFSLEPSKTAISPATNGENQSASALQIASTDVPSRSSLLVYSTYLGWPMQWTTGSGISIDSDGNTIATGDNGLTAYIIKLDPSTGQLAYPILMLDSLTAGFSVDTDSEGNSYVVGLLYTISNPDGTKTYSPFTPTPGAAAPQCDNPDSFIVKVNPVGVIEYAAKTCYGGEAIAVGSDGSAYVAGANYYQDPADGTFKQTADVMKISPTGDQILFSSSFGGSVWANPAAIVVDVNGAAYITGATQSPDFPTTPGAYVRVFCGHQDSYGYWSSCGFATKFTSGGQIAYSTFLGSNDYDSAASIAVDHTGAAYIALNSFVSPSIIKLDPTGSQALLTTHFARYPINIVGVAVDDDGYIYVAGHTADNDFPTTPDAYDPAGHRDENGHLTDWHIFVSKLNPSGSIFEYSSFLGGSDNNVVGSTRLPVDRLGNVYLSGTTKSIDFPITSNALPGGPIDAGQEEDGRGQDAFISVMATKTTIVPDQSAWYYSCIDSEISDLSTTCSNLGGSIDVRTGVLSYQTTDISILTTAGTLAFQRSYSSAALQYSNSGIGYGWTDNLDTRLIFPNDSSGQAGLVFLKAQSGNLYSFIDHGDGTFSPSAGVKGELTCSGSACSVILANHEIYSFLAGKIQSWQNPAGHGWTYNYSGDQLVQVGDEAGHYLQLHYSGNRLDSVSDFTNVPERTVMFTYDSNSGDLLNASALGQNASRQWQYIYQDHLLKQVKDPGGVTVEQTDYDTQGRAYRQYDAAGKKILELTFNPDNTTTMTNAMGSSSTYTFDSRNTIRQFEASLVNPSSRQYDLSLEPASITDPAGNETKLSWSMDGSGTDLTEIEDAAGGVTSIGYDSLHNPTDVYGPGIDPGTGNPYQTSFIYDGTLLSKITNALNGDTIYTYTTAADAPQPINLIKTIQDPQGRITYYEYNSDGFRVKTVTNYDPAHGPNEDNLYNLTTLYTPDALGRVQEITDPSGFVTKNEYDAAGRLQRAIRNFLGYPDAYGRNYEDVDHNIYNIITDYAYDFSGNQVAITDTYDVTNRTYYDSNNRPVTTVQNLSNWEIDNTQPPERGSGSLEQNVRTDTYYDDAGNVIATMDPAGVITRTYYDAASRPQIVVQNIVFVDGARNPLSIDDNLAQAISPDVQPPAYQSTYPDRNVRTETVYDSAGRAIATIDANESITRTYYDELNRPEIVVQHLSGQEIADNIPPARGGPLSLANLRTDTYYDTNGSVIATKDPLGKISRTYYDALNRPITVVQNMTAQALSVSVWNPANCARTGDQNLCTDTYYDDAGQVIATVDPLSHITRTYYDAAGRPTTVVQNWTGVDIYDLSWNACGTGADDENLCTTSTYDTSGRRLSTSDPLGHTTQYVYNDQGQLWKTILNPLDGQDDNYNGQYNITTIYTYDALGRQKTVTDPLNRVTLTQYDDLGRTTSGIQNFDNYPDPGLPDQGQNHIDEQQDYFNLITAYTYDAKGNSIATTDTLGMVNRTYFDSLGRALTQVRNLTGQDISIFIPPDRGSNEINLRTDTAYYGDGRTKTTTNERGYTSTYAYDELMRQTGLSDPLGHSSSSVYDAAGRLVASTDASGLITGFEYDSVGRLTAVIENDVPDGQASADTKVRTEYTYDANGNRLTLKDGNDHITQYTYDAQGHLLTETDPLSHTWTYIYDRDGNRAFMKDANGKWTSYFYDLLNRQIYIIYPPPDPMVHFTYDSAGRRLTMEDGLGTTTWEYDNLDRPISITNPFGKVVHYTYDALGNRASIQYPPSAGYPDGRIITYHYDSAHRLDAALRETDTLNSPLAGYEYNAASQLTSVTLANGVTTTYSYDDAGQLQSLTHTKGTDTLASYEYQYYSNGNQRQVEEHVTSLAGMGFLETTSSTAAVLANAAHPQARLENPVISWIKKLFRKSTAATNPSAAAQLVVPMAAVKTRTPTRTNTSTATKTSTATNTPTPTGNPLGFPSTPVLDDFNVRDGTLSDSWSVDDNQFQILNQQLTVLTQGEILWNRTSFGPDQEVYVTYVNVDPYATNMDLILKSQDAQEMNSLLEVGYNPFSQRVMIDTYTAEAGWVQCGPMVPATLTHGDHFGARMTEEGLVYVYKNGATIATCDASYWPDHANGGYIGLISWGSSGPIFDDFGGGTTVLPGNQVPTITPTPTGNPFGFPSTGMVDTFNRSNGSIGTSWSIDRSSFTINNNQLQALTEGMILWNPTSFGSDQEAYVTLVNVDPAATNMDLLLKSQSSSQKTSLLEVQYNPARQQVYIETYTSQAGYTECGRSIPIVYSNGDQLGARVTASGMVYVYKNGSSIATCDASYWPDYANGGYIGLVSAGGTASIFDNFGGGTTNTTATSTPTATATPTWTPTFTATFTATDTPTFTPTNTFTPTDTPTATFTATYTPTNTFTSTYTPTATGTNTLTPTSTLTPTATLTPTDTATATGTATYSPTQTFTATLTPTNTQTPSPTVTPSPTPIPGLITYTYDGLQRLTAADYSDGRFFHYTYDEVGNRLTASDPMKTINYVYDAANRLISVDGVTYTWDANGNLLNDGVNTYTYDKANHLISVIGPSGTITFTYDGLGNRYEQTVNGVLTRHILDLAANLTQVLGDGTNTYLYGVGRIAQVNGADTQYFLGDQLGSIRQLANALGNVTLARFYDPYGNEIAISGNVQTIYGFDAEQTDSYIKLINLRSRQYDPTSGRFLTRDSWRGDYDRPLSLNQWIFVEGNPINHVDPTGRFISSYLDFTYAGGYGDSTQPQWGDADEQALDNSAQAVAHALASTINDNLIYLYQQPTMSWMSWAQSFQRPVSDYEAFLQVYGGKVEIQRQAVNNPGVWATTQSPNRIFFYKTTNPWDLSNVVYSRFLSHELGHAFELAANGENDNFIRDYLNGDRDAPCLWAKGSGWPTMQIPEILRYSREGLRLNSSDPTKGYWQFHPDSNEMYEVFADMFVGWTYGGWADDSQEALAGRIRSGIMFLDMPRFIEIARIHGWIQGKWR